MTTEETLINVPSIKMNNMYNKRRSILNISKQLKNS